MGFQTGQDIDWLPRATTILRDELPNIEIRVSSDHSTTLADDLQRGKLDIAFLRREQKPDLEYKLVVEEPLVVILPSDHPLAKQKAIDPHNLVGETFIGISKAPRVLRAVVDDYLKRSEIEIVPHLEIDNLAMVVSLVASTRGVALLPTSAESFLKWSVSSFLPCIDSPKPSCGQAVAVSFRSTPPPQCLTPRGTCSIGVQFGLDM
jgi:LysR family transcriptional regulator, hca operon transcriptional activator